MVSEIKLHRRATNALGMNARKVFDSFVNTCDNLMYLDHSYFNTECDPLVMSHVEDALFRLRVVLEEMTA